MAGRYSSSVTCVPRSWYIEANSTPTAPAPTMTMLLGSVFILRTSSLVTMRCAVRNQARQALDAAAGREDDVRGLEDPLAACARRAVLARLVDPDPTGSLEAAAALHPRDLVLGHEALEARPHPLHDRVAAAGHLGVVDPGLARQDDPELLGVAEPFDEGSRFQQRLRGDAAAMEARAANLVLVDQGDPQAQLGRAEGGAVTTGPRAENHEVEGVAGADGHRSGAVLAGARRRVAESGHWTDGTASVTARPLGVHWRNRRSFAPPAP